MIKPFCGICGSRRKPHEFAYVDMRCPNTECIAYDVGLYSDMEEMYNIILEINKLAECNK